MPEINNSVIFDQFKSQIDQKIINFAFDYGRLKW